MPGKACSDPARTCPPALGEDQLADISARHTCPVDLDRGIGFCGGLAGDDLVQDRVEAGLGDRLTAAGGEELRDLIDGDRREARLRPVTAAQSYQST